MKCSPKTKILLLKTDLKTVFCERRGEILFYLLWLILGLAFGIYVGYKLGDETCPYSVFAALFRLEYAPFRWIFLDLLRFSIFALMVSLSYFLPLHPLYPIFSLLLFGKHYGEIACRAFLSDGAGSALLSLLLIDLPLFLVGGALLIGIALKAKEYRLCKSGFPCASALKRAGVTVGRGILAFTILLVALYLLLCGALYLLFIVI